MKPVEILTDSGGSYPVHRPLFKVLFNLFTPFTGYIVETFCERNEQNELVPVRYRLRKVHSVW